MKVHNEKNGNGIEEEREKEKQVVIRAITSDRENVPRNNGAPWIVYDT